MFGHFLLLFAFCTKTTQWHKKVPRNDKTWKRPKRALSASLAIFILLDKPFAISSEKTAILPEQIAKMVPTISLPNTSLNSDERLLLRRAFLRKFGLETLISTSNDSEKKVEKVPQYIWALYKKQNANAEVETIRHYAVSAHAQGEGILWMVFNLSATGRNAKKERIVRAELQLPKEKRVKGTVHKVRESREKPGKDGTELDEQRGGGEVTHLLREHPKEQEKLVLALRLSRGSDILATEHMENIALIVFTNSEKYEGQNPGSEGTVKRRTKRWTSSQRTDSVPKANDDASDNSGRRRKHRMHRKFGESGGERHQHQCRRTALYVDFKELNWNEWIIAPAGYEAYQCRGRCSHPLPAKLNTTNHAIVQSLIHSIDPDSVSAPSCVPIQMSAISILYKDINNVIVVKTYADMRVDACGCH